MLKSFLNNQKKCLSVYTKVKNKLETSTKQLPTKRTSNTSTTNKKMNRIWNSMENNADQCNSSTAKYKLMSYNILAQDLLTEHMYLYANTDVRWLRWEHRLKCLSNEILSLQPDILCLQEMQYTHLKGLFKQIRANRQLEYIFKKKTGHRTDGCAIIYDKSKFKLLEDKTLEYHNEDIRTLNREQIAIMAKFLLRDSNENDIEADSPGVKLVVATTHLLYNPRREDVRVSQINVLLKGLHEFTCSSKNEQAHLPVILTGDFNLEYDSPGYKLLHVPYRRRCKLEDLDENDTEQHLNTLIMKAHDYGCDYASTYQDGWKTVDFILNSLPVNQLSEDERIKIWSVYQLPSVGQCRRMGAIPNSKLGSDHYSLAIEFSVTNSKSSNSNCSEQVQ